MKARFLILLGLLLLGCQPTPTAVAIPTIPSTSGGNVTPLNSPLLFPTAILAATASAPDRVAQPTITIPVPSSGKAVVAGRVSQSRTGEAIALTKVFLARIYYSADGSNAVYGLDVRTAPRALTTTDGRFVFVDVEPGEYLVMVGDPTFSGSVKYSDSAGKDVVLKLVPGQTINLGDISVIF